VNRAHNPWTVALCGPRWTNDGGSQEARWSSGAPELWCVDPRCGGMGIKRRMRGSLPRAALGGGVIELGW
jgi:hypothetical protein